MGRLQEIAKGALLGGLQPNGLPRRDRGKHPNIDSSRRQTDSPESALPIRREQEHPAGEERECHPVASHAYDPDSAFLIVESEFEHPAQYPPAIERGSREKTNTGASTNRDGGNGRHFSQALPGALDQQEHILNCYCVAAPIFDASQTPIAAVGVSGNRLQNILAQAENVRLTAEIITHILAPAAAA